MGSVIKMFFTYDKAWWRTEGYSGTVTSLDGPATYIADYTEDGEKQSSLVLLVSGKYADEMRKLSVEERKQMVLE